MAGPANHTVRLTRGAKAQEPRPSGPPVRPNKRTPRRGNSRRTTRRNGRWARDADEAHSPARSDQHCEGHDSESHGRRRATPNGPRPSRENCPGAGPERGRLKTPATNDPRGRRRRRDGKSARRKARTHPNRFRAGARHENRMGDATRAWVSGLHSETPKRDGPEAGDPRTARRGRHTSKGREPNRTRDASADLSVTHHATGGQSAGPVTKASRASGGPRRDGPPHNRGCGAEANGATEKDKGDATQRSGSFEATPTSTAGSIRAKPMRPGDAGSRILDPVASKRRAPRTDGPAMAAVHRSRP